MFAPLGSGNATLSKNINWQSWTAFFFGHQVWACTMRDRARKHLIFASFTLCSLDDHTSSDQHWRAHDLQRKNQRASMGRPRQDKNPNMKHYFMEAFWKPLTRIFLQNEQVHTYDVSCTWNVHRTNQHAVAWQDFRIFPLKWVVAPPFLVVFGFRVWFEAAKKKFFSVFVTYARETIFGGEINLSHALWTINIESTWP